MRAARAQPPATPGNWPGGAAGILIPLFALTHGTNGQVLLGQAALGTALTLLRVRSGGLWLPIGYDWAWNVVQTALMGAPILPRRCARCMCMDPSAGWAAQAMGEP